jgi:hypothetical protein
MNSSYFKRGGCDLFDGIALETGSHETLLSLYPEIRTGHLPNNGLLTTIILTSSQFGVCTLIYMLQAVMVEGKHNIVPVPENHAFKTIGQVEVKLHGFRT